MNEQQALEEIKKYKYTGNCYLETGRGSDRVFAAVPGSRDDAEAWSRSHSSSRWTYLGEFKDGEPVEEPTLEEEHYYSDDEKRRQQASDLQSARIKEAHSAEEIV